MRVAVIGANLLGCATVLDLALVEEHDHRKGHTQTNFSVTLFERTHRLGGNSLKSHVVDDDLHVEVGTYRTIPFVPGTHLHDLIIVANAQHGTIPFLSKRIRVPGTNIRRRGTPDAVRSVSMWNEGSSSRLVRTFGLYDAHHDLYWLNHSGFLLLDILHRIFNNAIWRSVAFALTISAVRTLQSTSGHWPRAIALANVLVFATIFLLSPRNIVASWQRQYSFWRTTLSLLWTYGVTPAIARGSALGFSRHLIDANSKNAASISSSLNILIQRLGFKEHLRATAADFVQMFKLNHLYAERFIEPVVTLDNQVSSLEHLSSLALHFAMMETDCVNSDSSTRLKTVIPDNASLCNAFVNAAKETMPVTIRTSCEITRVEFDQDSKTYRLTNSTGLTEEFDGVILAASPCETDSNPLIKVSDTHAGLDELLCRKQTVMRQTHDADTTDVTDGRGDHPCSHIAVVVGQLRPSFFRYSHERDVPDLVTVLNDPSVAMVERVRETNSKHMGVYVVRCDADFKEENGVFHDMFEPDARVDYFDKMSCPSYNVGACQEEEVADDVLPPVVIGPRFLYAAAVERLAKHPEMDAIGAANVASLFSNVVLWSDGNEEDDTDGDGDSTERGADADLAQDNNNNSLLGH